MKTISLFISTNKDRKKLIHHTCSLPDGERCELYDNFKCFNTVFSSCKYRGTSVDESPKYGAKSYSTWLDKNTKFVDENKPKDTYYDNHSRGIFEISKYYHFNYSFINLSHDDDVKLASIFEKTYSMFSSAQALMLKEKFTVENLLYLCNRKIYALFGGEIFDYSLVEIPCMLFFLKCKFPDMYAKLIDADKTLSDRTFNPNVLDSLTCSLQYIPVGITKGYVIDKNLIPSYWDGKTLEIKSDQFSLGLFAGSLINPTIKGEVNRKNSIELKATVTDKELINTILHNNPDVIHFPELNRSSGKIYLK